MNRDTPWVAADAGDPYNARMDRLFDILILVAVTAVAITLLLGIRSLYRPGPAARSTSNKLMRLRVVFQAVAVALLCLAMWWRSTQGG